MSNWKLPASSVITDREENESVLSMQHRHERTRRLITESALIRALDLLRKIQGDITKIPQIGDFLSEFEPNLLG